VGVRGAVEQLTNFQVMYWVSAEPALYKAIQSLAVGDAIPAHVAVTVWPGNAEVGLAFRVVGRDDPVTLKLLLVATLVNVLLAKSRN
jgi:hypothetical protein